MRRRRTVSRRRRQSRCGGARSERTCRYPFTPRRVSSPSSTRRARSPMRVVVVPLRRVLRIRVQSAMTDASTPVRLGAWVRVESRRHGSPGHAPRESRSTPLGSRTPGLTDTDTDSGCARWRRRPLQIGASASAARPRRQLGLRTFLSLATLRVSSGGSLQYQCTCASDLLSSTFVSGR